MARAEYSQDKGELFRQKVAGLLIPLRYEIIGEKYAIECKSTVFHKSKEHTIDLLSRHYHAGKSAHKKTVAIESKKTFPSSLEKIPEIVDDLANKIECVSRKVLYAGTEEGIVFTDDDISLNQQIAFETASEGIAISRGYSIELVSGSKFRLFEAISLAAKQYSPSYSLTIINYLSKPDQDLGSFCPRCIGENSRLYLCALKAGELRMCVFKVDGENYTPENYVEDMVWIKDYSGVLDQIHSGGGFTDKAIKDIKDSGLKLGVIDHRLQRCFGTPYLNYTMPP